MANDEGEDWKKAFEEKKELEEEEEEDQIIAPPKSNEERVCGLCSKIFKSGKALGGHMRFHFSNKNKDDDDKQQQQQNKKKKKKKKTKTINQEKEKDSEENVEIPRSHPDRDWRGCLPPSNGSTRNDDEQMDMIKNHDRINGPLMLMLSNWKVTGNRGSKGNKSRKLIEEDEELLQAAMNLWILSRDCRGKSTTHTPPPSSILRGSSSQAALADVAAESDHILPAGTSENVSTNNKNKRKLVMDSEPCQKYMKYSNVNNQNEYQCNICNKRFMSHHGLNGHMSFHYNRERNINNSKQDIAIGIELYGCRWCKKRFSTAQDLEDHKCHKSINGGPLTIGGVCKEDNNNVLNLCFDLNDEMPSLQEDVHKPQPSSSDDNDDNSPRVTPRASEG